MNSETSVQQRGEGGFEEPEARVRKGARLSWIWLAPLAALALVTYLIYTVVSERGALISITFATAEGLTANQTKVKYKAVDLGTVEEIELSDDLSHVVVKVRMENRAESLLNENARFWVVRPRLGGGLSAFQTGLETLVSGAYVALDPGSSMGGPRRHFEGLEMPPSVRSDEPGTTYFLEADALGGLSAGAAVHHHEVQVGEVLGYELEESTARVKIRIFVRAPYDQRVVKETRFWNISGIQLTSDAGGLRVKVNSLRSVLSGGIAFRTPEGFEKAPASPPDSSFRLYPDWASAEVEFHGPSVPYVSYFQGSVRGLTAGSAVHMFGTELGSVTDVSLVSDPRPGHEGELAARVAYVLQPQRALAGEERQVLGEEGIGALVDDQLRVVLTTSNLVTGEKVLSLEYVPGAGPATLHREDGALVLPSETQNVRELVDTITELANHINRIPFERIGDDVRRTLAAVERTVAGPELRNALLSLDTTLSELRGLTQEARAGLGPALARLPRISQQLERAVESANQAFGQHGYGQDSTLQRNLERMMEEVADAARSIRLLSDYLNRHPEALVRGRTLEQP